MKFLNPPYGRKSIAVLICIVTFSSAWAHSALADCQDHDAPGDVAVERLHFASGEGEGYRMRYCVAVPIEIYWRFKTDFHNDFLTDNPHIAFHRMVRREGAVVETENRYTHNRKRLFRWQTRVYADQYQLDFELLNPEEAGQKFHYGTIRFEAIGRSTMVYQQARFQFSGAAFWAFYPWRGGMRSFLRSFAVWEQQAAQSWQSRYEAERRREERAQARMRQVFPVNKRYPDK